MRLFIVPIVALLSIGGCIVTDLASGPPPSGCSEPPPRLPCPYGSGTLCIEGTWACGPGQAYAEAGSTVDASVLDATDGSVPDDAIDSGADGATDGGPVVDATGGGDAGDVCFASPLAPPYRCIDSTTWINHNWVVRCGDAGPISSQYYTCNECTAKVEDIGASVACPDGTGCVDADMLQAPFPATPCVALTEDDAGDAGPADASDVSDGDAADASDEAAADASDADADASGP
ncbi:MAG: hypothetical protein FWD17_02320 [Polyangiaceae bacterium]|nr:hypothetical protein [Polyangiaceae bacterium]